MSIDEVDAVIRADASITHRFMKFLGAAVFSFRADIRSVRHGLALIGKEQIRQFVSLVALGGMGSDKSHELLVTAAVRGKFCELIGDDIMMPMSEVLEVLPLTDDMNLALQGKASPLRPALKFVECYERADWAACAELSRTHGIVETKVLDRYTERSPQPLDEHVVHLARIIHEEADYSRKTNAPVWYKGCAHRPFATTEALA